MKDKLTLFLVAFSFVLLGWMFYDGLKHHRQVTAECAAKHGTIVYKRNRSSIICIQPDSIIK